MMKMSLNGYEVQVLSFEVVEDAIESELGELYSVVFRTDAKLKRLGYEDGEFRTFSMVVEDGERKAVKRNARLIIVDTNDNEIQVFVRIKFE